ncbi:group II intron reverse transcriptase domain-containing protein [Arthrobacter sp. ISL-28]|nr:group II intron reverse transcriptase domain-containing protein [Arthrobacter sp. ISL-28]
MSPLLANIALSALEDQFIRAWEQQMATEPQRQRRKRHGQANYRLVRYADDFVVLVTGQREHAEQLRQEVTTVLAPMGLRLSPEKTQVVHIDDGFDFLGYNIRRMHKRGSNKWFVYTRPFEEGDRLDQEPSEDHDVQIDSAQRARIPAGLSGSGASRVGELLPTRSVQGHVLRDRLLCVGADHGMATEEAAHRMARTTAQVLPARNLAARRRRDKVQGRSQRLSHPVPLPRLPDPDPVDTLSPHRLSDNPHVESPVR